MSEPETEKPSVRAVSYLTVPQFHRLNWSCMPIRQAWGSPYLVGSVLRRADYRDVDLRLIVEDDLFEAMFGDYDEGISRRRRVTSLLVINCAISEWLAKSTGLPIDFQFQPLSESRRDYDGFARNPMGLPR